MTKRTVVYLSGACRNVPVEVSAFWRKYARNLFSNDVRIEVFNPCDHFMYGEHDPRNSKLIMDYFLQMIKKSDIVLVNLNFSDKSVGTGMEIQKAVDEGKMVIGFGNTEVYDYIKDCCSAVFKDVDSAIDFIITHY